MQSYILCIGFFNTYIYIYIPIRNANTFDMINAFIHIRPVILSSLSQPEADSSPSMNEADHRGLNLTGS